MLQCFRHMNKQHKRSIISNYIINEMFFMLFKHSLKLEYSLSNYIKILSSEDILQLRFICKILLTISITFTLLVKAMLLTLKASHLYEHLEFKRIRLLRLCQNSVMSIYTENLQNKNLSYDIQQCRNSIVLILVNVLYIASKYIFTMNVNSYFRVRIYRIN